MIQYSLHEDGWVESLLQTLLHHLFLCLVVDDDVIDATVEKNGTPVPKRQIKTINPAQAVSIVDAASTIAKVNAENEALKQQVETMRKDMEKIQEFIKAGGLELLRM